MSTTNRPAQRTDGQAIVARGLLVLLAILAVVLIARLIAPFASAFFIAAVLAGAVYPWFERLEKRLGARRKLAAALITTVLVLALMFPLAAIGGIALREAIDGIGFVQKILQSEGVHGLVFRLPPLLQSMAERALSQVPDWQKKVAQMLGIHGSEAAAAVSGALRATSGAIVQTVMMLIAFYFLLVDGKSLTHWLEDLLPLRRTHFRAMLSEFRRVSIAVLVSTAATAGVQAAAAGLGYLLASVPQPLFFALLTFFVGLIPVGGASLVSLALALLIYMNGHPMAALFLAIWSLAVVGLVDNIVKPLLIRGGVELHGAVIFFALLGGLVAFGPMGLVAGPLVVVFFLAVVRMCKKEFGEELQCEPPNAGIIPPNQAAP